MKGIFITFEGPDGSGKTTQIKKLADSLTHVGYDVVVTREPGGTVISDQIRSILLSPHHTEMVDQAEVLLYAASRAQHVMEVIYPSLEQNKIVLCDRYIDASVAYQGYGLGIDPDFVKLISEFASAKLQPKRTYMLDVPVQVSLERIHHRAVQQSGHLLDRIELKHMDYHSKVREGFLCIAQHNTERIKVIQAVRSEVEIAHEIWEDCRTLLEQYK
jgi:dTMP kinase